MTDDHDFRIRPGRIRSTSAQRARPFIAQALAAAQRAGGSVSRQGKIGSGARSRFGRQQLGNARHRARQLSRARVRVPGRGAIVRAHSDDRSRPPEPHRMTVAVLAEKPSVARDIARVLGAAQRAPGCLRGNGYAVTWAIGHLVALKLLSNDTRTRPQDSADLRALRRELDQVEVARAREACALIEIRGFARGRDLKAALETYLADDPEP